MEGPENRRAVELIMNLADAQGVFADSMADNLFVVSYPNEEVGPLYGFTKKDLEVAIKLKLLAKARTKRINGEECQVYMKTVNAANEG